MQLGPTPPSDQPSDQARDARTEPAETTQPVITEPPAGPRDWLDRLRAEDSMLPQVLLIAGMALLIFVAMRALRKNTAKDRRRSNNRGTPAERIAELRENAHSGMEPSRRLMVDAEEMARRVGAALDNKAARLELLIEEADAKLEELNRRLGSADKTARPGSRPRDAEHEPPPAQPRALDPSLLDRARLEQDLEERQTRVAGRIPPRQPDHQANDQPRSQPQPDREPQEESISDRIQGLADSGMSSSDIARELDQPVGQVELILNLRRQSHHS